MHDTGCLELVHWDDPEGWYGEGEGTRVQDGDAKVVPWGDLVKSQLTLGSGAGAGNHSQSKESSL